MKSSKPETLINSSSHYTMAKNGNSQMLISNGCNGAQPSIKYTVVPTNTSHAAGQSSAKVDERSTNGEACNKKSVESVSFIPKKGDNCVYDKGYTKKDTRTKCEKFSLYSGIVGLIFVLSAVIW